MKQITQAIGAIIQELFKLEVGIELTRPDEQFGDYSTNVALQLAARVQQSPRAVAEQIAERLQTQLADTVQAVEVAGPGFINLKLTDAALLQSAVAALEQRPQHYAGQTVLVEYSDPNPFKPLHAGHLYTTLVGDQLARLIEHAGAHVVRLNYGGDVGLHVAKSMWAIVRDLGGEVPEKLADVPEAERSQWLGARYVEGNTAYETHENTKAEIIALNKKVYELQAKNDHDSPFAQIYWTCRQWSYDAFRELYRQLQIVPFERFIPESEVTQLGVEAVAEQLKRGVFTRSDGAVVFEGERVGLHTRVFVNSNGLPTYETKDVGLSLTKWRDYHFDRSIIITANEQAQYMQVVIAAIKQFMPEPAERTQHLTHGMVRLQGGVKISSRKGNGPSALEILAAAREAGQETGTNPSEETILAAVKYAFAKNRIGGDIIYNPKESIALEGNSGPYLQYAHARARSILAKAPAQIDAGAADLDAPERSLARKIAEYPEVVSLAAAELMPHHICGYLYELAQVFNRFYEQSRVIGDAREGVRLQLVSLYADILQAGLGLLGIAAPERL